jgi:hypothetical protein
MHTGAGQPVIDHQHCDTCGQVTEWAGLYGEDMTCECGSTDQPYDPFDD